MSEIFISYARKDKARVELLAKALKESGWSVWWDPDIATGERFDLVIERALAESKCIIVVWTSSSISSNYVRAEASEGAERQILFPVMFEEVRVPLAFRQIQTSRLIDWHGSLRHPGFEQLVKDISIKLSPTPTLHSAAASSSVSVHTDRGAQLWRVIQRPSFKVFATLVFTALLIAFALWIFGSWSRGQNPSTNTSNATTLNENANSSPVLNNTKSNSNIEQPTDTGIRIVSESTANDNFTIEMRFLGELTETQRAAFKAAANRWTRLITGGLPSVQVDGEVIDDLLILVTSQDIDGPGGITGQAGPTRLRPASAGASAFLPAKGKISIDKADMAKMEKEGSLEDYAAHFIGEVLGLGTLWSHKDLIRGMGTDNPVFVGKNAEREYAALLGKENPLPVPIENTGGPGTRYSGWRESVFMNEIMTMYKSSSRGLISRVSAGALEDMGYRVDYQGTDDFKLPKL